MELNPQKYCFLWNKINIGYEKVGFHPSFSRHGKT